MPTPVQTFTPIHNWVASSNVFSVSFGSINQSYDHLIITGGFTRNLDANAGGRSAQFQWNGLTSGYKNQYLIASGGSTSGGAGFSASDASGPNASSGNPNYQGNRPAWEICVPYYSSTGFRKHAFMKGWTVDDDVNSGGYVILNDSLVPTTSALTSLYIFQQVDSWIVGDWITIYGVKNA